MTRLHHIGITVGDTEHAVAFYTAATGGTVIGPFSKSGPAVEAATGYPGVEVIITFVQMPGGVFIELAEYRGANAAPLVPDNGRAGSAHPAIVVEDVNESLSRLAKLGHHPLSDTMTATAGPLEGYRYVYVLGPDAVRVELLQEPH